MRVPLEILRSILEHVQEITTRVELLRLRLVNSTFDQEILSLLFTDTPQAPHPPSPFHDQETLSHRYWRWISYTDRTRSGALTFRFINSANWTTVPASLQRKYLRFRLTRYGDQQSLFAGLFIGVRELVSSMRAVSEEGDSLTETMLSLCAFESKTAWVAAHHAPNLFKVVCHMNELCCVKGSDGGEPQDGDENEDTDRDPHFQTWTSQISTAYNYLLAALPLLHSSPPSLSQILTSNPDIDILATALPFGASILTFAISRASPPSSHTSSPSGPSPRTPPAPAPSSPPPQRPTASPTLPLLPPPPRFPAPLFLPPSDTHSILSILYTEFARIRILARKSRPEKLLAKAIWRDDAALVDFLIEKVEGGKWVGELKASMEAVLAVGGSGSRGGIGRG
ncbi:hypothetical protein GRF29_28g456360 [Pseudopithomyces chartarum]|uniref:Uncharacterized protein n=1 Tax=Pseudopithomyces chartarum TaxID=1892770 RepID=A0AAN6RIH1_9PLEO|nr:hypothetical protein GRF29_28g456360 [Pseudopithomyces chartarum]